MRVIPVRLVAEEHAVEDAQKTVDQVATPDSVLPTHLEVAALHVDDGEPFGLLHAEEPPWGPSTGPQNSNRGAAGTTNKGPPFESIEKRHGDRVFDSLRRYDPDQVQRV